MNLRIILSRMLAAALVITVQGCGSFTDDSNPDADNGTSDGAGDDPMLDPGGDDPADDMPSTFLVTFTFHNQDFDNIHILLPGDSFGTNNRIEPGSTMLGVLVGVAEGSVVELRAGRNGTVLRTATCPPVSVSTMAYEATWTASSFVGTEG